MTNFIPPPMDRKKKDKEEEGAEDDVSPPSPLTLPLLPCPLQSDHILRPRLHRPTAMPSAALSTLQKPSAPWRRSTRRRRPLSWWRLC